MAMVPYICTRTYTNPMANGTNIAKIFSIIGLHFQLHSSKSVAETRTILEAMNIKIAMSVFITSSMIFAPMNYV